MRVILSASYMHTTRVSSMIRLRHRPPPQLTISTNNIYASSEAPPKHLSFSLTKWKYNPDIQKKKKNELEIETNCKEHFNKRIHVLDQQI